VTRAPFGGQDGSAGGEINARRCACAQDPLARRAVPANNIHDGGGQEPALV